MFELIFPTVKVIIITIWQSSNCQGHLFNLYRTAQSFFFSKFHKVFQTQTKLYQPKKQKK